MKKFNVTGTCIASENYMVNTSERIEKIVKMVEERKYFTINRARQYGKTTTLSLLKRRLDREYICARMSFEGIGETSFSAEENFCIQFKKMLGKAFKFTSLSKKEIEKWNLLNITSFADLSEHITELCENKKIVLLIDEVDKASDYHIFLEFLGMLRDKFLLRKDNLDYTFHSVVLAGVHDIKNIKDKIFREGKRVKGTGEGNYNSPWNIAADFEIDMSFNVVEISDMLDEYEKDHNTGMNVSDISQEIFKFTEGYPYLVSRICQHIDEKLGGCWTKEDIKEAVKLILIEDNTLFDDLFKNMENNKNLYDLIYDMLIVGSKRTYASDNPTIKLGLMYGIIKNKTNSNYLIISNRIFEIRICNYFIAKDEEKRVYNKITGILQYDVIHDGKFNMELCLRKFAKHYQEIYNPNNNEDMAFLERHGRMIFLSYLKPLINGQGFYHIESQLTDLRRMDIVVDYGNEQFIIELKIWHGDAEHQKAYEQLMGYLDNKKTSIGYLLTFDFRKNVNKETKAEWVQLDGKKIFDVVV